MTSLFVPMHKMRRECCDWVRTLRIRRTRPSLRYFNLGFDLNATFNASLFTARVTQRASTFISCIFTTSYNHRHPFSDVQDKAPGHAFTEEFPAEKEKKTDKVLFNSHRQFHACRYITSSNRPWQYFHTGCTKTPFSSAHTHTPHSPQTNTPAAAQHCVD